MTAPLPLTIELLRYPTLTVNKVSQRYRKKQTPEERFWAKLLVAGPDDCWEWQGTKGRWGYGILSVNGKRLRAHRISYVLHHGQIPDGMFVMHSCDNPPCANPAHLSIGTPRENTADAVDKGRQTGAPKGLANGKGKLSDDDVRAIRAAYDAGESCTSIARRLGVHDTYVGLIARRLRRAAT